MASSCLVAGTKEDSWGEKKKDGRSPTWPDRGFIWPKGLRVGLLLPCRFQRRVGVGEVSIADFEVKKRGPVGGEGVGGNQVSGKEEVSRRTETKGESISAKTTLPQKSSLSSREKKRGLAREARKRDDR